MVNKVEIRDTLERVSGEIKYVDDFKRVDLLHGKYVRSTCAKGEIKSIDCRDAASMQEVVGIYSYLDFPEGVPKYGPSEMDQPILAEKEVRFFGEPVAIVIAETSKAAEAAAALVKIEYEPEACVIDPREAIRPGAAQVHKSGNINTVFKNSWGDCVQSEKDSELIISNEYYMPSIHHNAMETYTCIAEPDHGGVSITAAIQSPFQLRRIVSAMLKIPFSLVQVKGTELGGAFGGRGYPKAEPAAAYFAFKLKKPIKIKLSAEEGFLVGQRESAFIKIRNGFDSKGKITFHDIEAYFGNGAYLDISPRVVGKAGMLGTAAYKIENVKIDFKGVYTNTTPTTAFRGFGATHVCFAIESQLDEAARALGIDPVDIRLLNLPERGDIIIPNEKPVDGDWKSCLKKAVKLGDYYKQPPKGRFKSIAIGIKNSIAATTASSRVRINSDGSAIVYIGTSEMGQGSRIVAAKYVNRFLGIPLEKIHVITADTESVPFDFITASSRTTVSIGIAIENACKQLKEMFLELATQNYKQKPVSYAEGHVVLDDNSKLSLKEILEKEYGRDMGEREACGIFKAKKDASNPLGGPCTFYELVATVLEGSVDRETGEIKFYSIVNVSDAGNIINPIRASGVDEGGAIMGIGAAVMEHLQYDTNGRLQNGSSLDYRLPTTLDVPERMESYFVENLDGPGPGGEKGIGEGAILGIAPAVKEIIFKSTGLNIKELPYTSEKIWRQLRLSRI